MNMENIKIQHQSMRSAVRDVLRNKIAQGSLKPGEKLEEEKLSSLLGVSRTPIREALFGLEREGLVDFVPNKGCHVSETNSQKVRELYPMIGVLEAMSIRTTEGFNSQTIKTMWALIDQMEDRDSTKRGDADQKWHDLLIENSGNETLIETTKNLRLRVIQFDDFAERGIAEPEEAAKYHRKIVNFLVQNEYEAAADLIEQHWLWGVEVVCKWLANRRINDVV